MNNIELIFTIADAHVWNATGQDTTGNLAVRLNLSMVKYYVRAGDDRRFDSFGVYDDGSFNTHTVRLDGAVRLSLCV